MHALLFFVLPVRMKAKTLGWGLIGFSVVCAALHIIPQIGHLAHLGGALAGAALTRWWLRGGARQTVRAATPAATTDELLERVMEAGIDSLSREERRRLELLAADRRGPRRSGRW